MISCKYNKNVSCSVNRLECERCEIEKVYQQGKADVWSDIEKIINSITNPIDTMKIIIEQLKEQKNE